jgi:hypothetical protein
VKVTGFAASHAGFFGHGGRSFSIAYVTIVRRG